MTTSTYLKPGKYSFGDRRVGADMLSQWEQRQVERDRSIPAFPAGDDRVTVLAYHFWDEPRFDRRFDEVECAILETWRHCGIMKTVVVCNRVTAKLEDFAARHSGHVTIQQEQSLIPGRIYTMSADCNKNLHRRFDTDYLLIVQNDGFPIRGGLEEYVGKFDFIGAPYVRNKWYLQAVCKLLKCQVCNGGFSLRSHEITELAAYYWDKKYHAFPESDDVSEDYFYTKTLPLREPKFRQNIRMPSYAEAIDFSYDAVFPLDGRRIPFGFHSPLSFKILHEQGWINDNRNASR